MSATFQNPVDDEMMKHMAEFFGQPVATDRKIFLYDELPDPLVGGKVAELAKKDEQPLTVEINDPGEIKTLSDGTKYRVTQKGWQKIVTIID